MFKIIGTIFSNNFLRLKQTLLNLSVAILIVVVLPAENFAQSLPDVNNANPQFSFVNKVSHDNLNLNFSLFDRFLLQFKNNKGLFNQKTYYDLENNFRNEVVYLSKNDIYGFELSINNYNTLNFTTTQIAPYFLEPKLNESYSFVDAKAVSDNFISTVDKNLFYHSYSTNINDIQTTEVSVLSFQSEAASQYLSGTKIWGGIGFAMFGTLMLLPRSVTKWEEDYLEQASSNFSRAFSEPPVMDEDHWEINYIGHPYAGSLYYNTIRSQGGSMLHSFVFSAFVSTGWEYLYEGAAEQPSIQDLIVTPVIGSILGEVIHQTTLGMKSNGYSIWEAMFVTLFNPMDVIQNGYD